MDQPTRFHRAQGGAALSQREDTTLTERISFGHFNVHLDPRRSHPLVSSDVVDGEM